MESTTEPSCNAERRQEHLTAEHSFCEICGVPIAPACGDSTSTCDAWTCHVTHSTREFPCEDVEIDPLRRRQLRQPQGATTERDQAAGRLGIDHPERFKPALLHAVALHVIATPEMRRQGFITHVREILHEAEGGIAAYERHATGAPRDNSGVPASALAWCACALCAGACCQGGSDTGFLSRDDMLAVLVRRPGSTTSDLYEAYVSYLPQYIIDGSCIFHTIKGCALPVRLRAETCNTFECNGFRSLMREFHEHSQRHFCLFARRPYAPPRILFIEADSEEGVREHGIAPCFGLRSCGAPGDQSQTPDLTVRRPCPC